MSDFDFEIPNEYAYSPKRYRPIRIMAHLIRFISLIVAIVGMVIVVVGFLSDTSTFILSLFSSMGIFGYAFAIFVGGSVLEMLADIATNVHASRIALERIANRRRRQ